MCTIRTFMFRNLFFVSYVYIPSGKPEFYIENGIVII